MDYEIDWKSQPAPWNHKGLEIATVLKRIACEGLSIDQGGRPPLKMELQCKNCGNWFGNPGALASHRRVHSEAAVAADVALLRASGKRF